MAEITLKRTAPTIEVAENLSEEKFSSVADLFDALKNKYNLPVSEENEKAIAAHPYTEFKNNEFINRINAAYAAAVTYQITIN